MATALTARHGYGLDYTIIEAARLYVNIVFVTVRSFHASLMWTKTVRNVILFSPTLTASIFIYRAYVDNVTFASNAKQLSIPELVGPKDINALEIGMPSSHQIWGQSKFVANARGHINQNNLATYNHWHSKRLMHAFYPAVAVTCNALKLIMMKMKRPTLTLILTQTTLLDHAHRVEAVKTKWILSSKNDHCDFLYLMPNVLKIYHSSMTIIAFDQSIFHCS